MQKAKEKIKLGKKREQVDGKKNMSREKNTREGKLKRKIVKIKINFKRRGRDERK